MRKLRVGDVLVKSRDSMTVDDETEYRQVTVRLKHQGVCLRGYKLGKEIGTKQQSYARAGQFILSKIDARNGAFGIIPDELDGAIITNDFLTYDVNEKELNIELFRLLTSQPAFDDICNKASTGTTNRKRLSEREFLAQEITVPPIEEQDAFITHFKKLQSAQEQTLAELQTQSDLIAKLRASILSDAVSGRLVPQDLNDEPASILLEKIRAEKECLIKEGKIKREKPLPPIAEDEIPYELPKGWTWCRLDDLVSKIGSGSTPSGGQKAYIASGIPFLRSQNVWNDGLRLNDVAYIKDEQHKKMSGTVVYPNDILINITGASIGRAAIAQANDFTEANVSQHVSIVRLIEFTTNKYIHVVLISDYIFSEIMNVQVGISREGLSKAKLSNLLIPLPPINEQHRIVAKVEQLMATCDALEAEVAKSRTETDRLMQTILKEAFAQKPQKQSEPNAPKAFQRSVLAAYLIDNSQDDPYFGHVKLQKMLFMCEAVNNLDFDTDYRRHAMGPYDPKLIRSVDTQLKKSKWFEVKKIEGEISRYVYHPLEKVDEYKKYVGRYWDHSKIEHIFNLMRKMTTLQAEIVATLYSANTDLKKSNEAVSDEVLINEARNNWHDNKKNIPIEKWQTAIKWLKTKGLL